MNLAAITTTATRGSSPTSPGRRAAFMLLASERLNCIHVSTHVSAAHRHRARHDRARARHHRGRPRPFPAQSASPQGADRGRRHQPALRRGWAVRHRGHRLHRPRGGGGPRQGHRRRRRPHLGRHGLRPRLRRRLRSGGLAVPRPGSHPDQAGRLRDRRERLARLRHRPGLGRPRTAFDIAGTGKAHHENMLSAIAYARLMDRSPRARAA